MARVAPHVVIYLGLLCGMFDSAITFGPKVALMTNHGDKQLIISFVNFFFYVIYVPHPTPNTYTFV